MSASCGSGSAGSRTARSAAGSSPGCMAGVGPDRADGRADAGGRGRPPPGARPRRKPAFTPTRRGGGGELKTLWWQAVSILNCHLAVGVKDNDGSRLFYEPLAAFDPDGNLVPILAAEVPTLENGGVAQGRPVGDLEAQEERPVARRQALHRGRRRVHLGVRGRPGDRRDHRRQLQGHRPDRQDRQPHGQDRLQEPDAVLGDLLLRPDGARHSRSTSSSRSRGRSPGRRRPT